MVSEALPCEQMYCQPILVISLNLVTYAPSWSDDMPIGRAIQRDGIQFD